MQVVINKHYEYSRLIEDIVSVQALDSLRMFYTEDAGYALARQKDTDIIRLGRDFAENAGDADYATGDVYIGSNGTTAYSGSNGAALTDAAIRRFIQRLDDNDVPMSERYLVVPPAERNNLMGLDRFTEQAFVGEVGRGNTIRNGQIGDLYGVKVFVTPQCDTSTNTDSARIGLIFHRDVAVVVSQMGVRTQTQYKQEYLGDLFTADHLYGVKCLRPGTTEVPTSGFAIALAP